MIENFYGGPAGKSFIISWIFSTKFGSGNSMENDINMGWKSSIAVGSYVVISYGEPNSDDYKFYEDQDITASEKTYNSTLWQKVYNENSNINNGIDYKLILSMAGYTPRIEFITPNDVLDADQLPNVIFDRTHVDHPTIKLQLPQSQILSMSSPIDILDADQMPEVLYDAGSRDADGNIVVGPQGGTINRPILTFRLPQSQRIQLGTLTSIKANEKPRIELDLTTNINEPKLNFWLPVSQLLGEGVTTILNADEDPRFEIDSTDPDNPILNFWLPQSQVMQQPSTEIKGPITNPSVVLNNENINSPKLEFTLPRAVRFYYGSLLGNREDTNNVTNEDFSDYAIGDYYINAATGFIYQVVNKPGDTTCDFKYIACIQSPLPDIEPIAISPYQEDGTQNNPSVRREFTNDQQTAWKLVFSLPKIPLPDVEVEFIAPADSGDAQVTISDPNTMLFSLQVPRGSRMFSSIDLIEANQLNFHIDGAEKGDLCINPESGKVFIQTARDIWTIQQGSLKGPTGDALHIVKSYEFTSLDGEDLLSVIAPLIEKNFLEDESFWIDSDGNGTKDTPRLPKDDEIISVTWRDGATGIDDVSYWYYYNERDGWQRVQLTAGFYSAIMTEYDPEDSANKLYSTGYINSLIGGNIPLEDYNKKTFSVDQLLYLLEWGDLVDVETDTYPPEPGFTHNTLSATEILALISWGDIATLYVDENKEENNNGTV